MDKNQKMCFLIPDFNYCFFCHSANIAITNMKHKRSGEYELTTRCLDCGNWSWHYNDGTALEEGSWTVVEDKAGGKTIPFGFC